MLNKIKNRLYPPLEFKVPFHNLSDEAKEIMQKKHDREKTLFLLLGIITFIGYIIQNLNN